MNQALLLDFNINRPFSYMESFRSKLKGLDVELNALSKDDVKKGLPQVLEEKFEECDFLVVRKPFAVLSGEKMQGLVQDAVTSGKVGLLVLFSFSEMDAMVIMNQFLSPFNITTTDIMVWDESSNFNDTKKLVVFRKDAGALRDEQLFQGVKKLLVPQPHHLNVDSPAVPILVGNPTCVANRFYEAPGEQIDGADIVSAAVNEENGRVLVMDSTPFINDYLQHNTEFLKNVVKWLREG